MSVLRFLADEDLRYPIVLATRRFEPAIEFATVIDLGLSGKSDDEVLAYASANGWFVVSHDVNTMTAAAEARLSAGLGLSCLFVVPQSRSNRSVAEDLVLIWSASQTEEWIGRIVFLPL
ncbi:MAG: hypothetical protein JWL69_513 [Phycisphaerales bacterium]|jgi:hypothetical protein|nr:hypothetical protein [Phycisphaerales bacterium]MDB5355745.1 hypothetical protein [Phycisphaerales bacterium]